MNEEEAINFICPLLKHSCKGSKCMFWLYDLNNRHNDGCALVRIARGLK